MHATAERFETPNSLMKFLIGERERGMAAVCQESQYKIIVKRYIAERLRISGYNIQGYDEESVGVPDTIAVIARTLRRVGDELEQSNADFFSTMCNSLQITANTAYPTFQGIADEIFSSGKNWGRIVAFLTFGASLAVHCASRPDLGEEYVDRVVNWTTRYMEVNLEPWIREHGSWVSDVVTLCAIFNFFGWV